MGFSLHARIQTEVAPYTCLPDGFAQNCKENPHGPAVSSQRHSMSLLQREARARLRALVRMNCTPSRPASRRRILFREADICTVGQTRTSWADHPGTARIWGNVTAVLHPCTAGCKMCGRRLVAVGYPWSRLQSHAGICSVARRTPCQVRTHCRPTLRGTRCSATSSSTLQSRGSHRTSSSAARSLAAPSRHRLVRLLYSAHCLPACSMESARVPVEEEVGPLAVLHRAV